MMIESMTIEEEIKMFEEIIGQMLSIYRAKHLDYGQSTKDTYKEYGPVSMLVRMTDKFNRIKSLICKEKNRCTPYVLDESIEDTLLDLANYCIIFVIEHRDANRLRKGGVICE